MIKQKQSGLILGLINVQSLNTGQDELTVSVERYKPDILALNETWLKDGQDICAPKIPGYHLKHNPRVCRTGGGVGFYVRRGVRARVIAHPPSPLEQMWLELTLPGIGLVAVGTAYRPEAVTTDDAMDALNETISSLGHCKHLFVLTDLNIDLLKPDLPKAVDLHSFLSQLSLEQMVREPTRITATSSTLLDLVITDSSELCKAIKVYHNNALSDHGMVVAEFTVKKPKEPKRFISTRSIARVNTDSFLLDLKSLPWHEVREGCGVNVMQTRFNALIVDLFNKHAPLKRVLVRPTPSPWLTDTVRKMMSLRNKALDRAHETKLESHWTYYKKFRNLVNDAIKKEKTAFFTFYVNRHNKNPMVLWKHLKRSALIGNHITCEIPQHLNHPEPINTFFINAPGDPHADKDLMTFYRTTKFGNGDFVINCCTAEQVRKIIRDIDTNAAGHDTLTAEMIRMTLSVTLPLITLIVNQSISSNVFPDDWKIGKIKPIPKGNTVEELKDLRPISILPVLSKVIERVVCTQLTEYLETQMILPNVQSGFRAGHGTETALAHVTDEILAESDEGNGTILVLLDFSRAFDCINTELLLSKMAYYGISASALAWFQSYLANRKQFVVVDDGEGNDIASRLQPISRGCPQGAILSPLLFVLYTADLRKRIKHCKVHLYADDTQLYFSFKPGNVDDAVAKINEDLDIIHTWARQNALVLNPNKSKFLVMGTAHQSHSIILNNPILKIDNQRVEMVYIARNLGLTLDSQLRYEEHINSKIRNAFYRLKVLYKIRQFLTEEVRKVLTESLVLSLFNYCDTVYGPRLFVKSERAIQRVQNACARFCFDVPKRAHITPYLNEKNILKMHGRRKLHLACLIQKVVHREIPVYLYEKFKWSGATKQRSARLRYFNSIIGFTHKTVGFRGSFRFAAAKIWNDLPPPLRRKMSNTTFKEKVRSLFFRTQLLQG